jgi:hypothetical protein
MIVLTYGYWVQDGSLLKQLAGAVGGSVTQGITSAIKETAGTSWKKQYQKVAR